MQNRLSLAIKAFQMTWSGQGGGSWGTFDKLTDPWWDRNRFDYTKSAGEARFNSTVAACVAWMQRAFTEPTLQVRRLGDDEPIPGHPLVELFRRPNPYYTSARLWHSALPDWVYGGNSYFRKEPSNGGGVARLWYIPAAVMKPVWPNAKATGVYIDYYERTDTKEKFKPEEIIHFRFGTDPDNERLGWSPLRAGLRELANLNGGADYRGALLSQMGTPPYTAQPKDPQRVVTEEIANRLKQLWAQVTSGVNRFRLLVPTVPLDFQKLGFSPQEMDIISSLEWDQDVICALVGLNSMVTGLPANAKGRTYSNMEEANRAAVEHNLIPTQDVFAQDLTLQVPELVKEGEYVTWDRSKVRVLQDDEHKRWMRVIMAKDKGILTPNEARNMLDAKLGDLPEQAPAPPLPQPVAVLPEGGGVPPVPAMNGKGLTAERVAALREFWATGEVG